MGVVQLDSSLTVVAMNSFARRVLPGEDKQPFEKKVLSFHPERSVTKVKFLLAERLDGASFLRIHRSDLANLEFAEQIVRGDGTALPVARACVPRLLERLGLAEADAPRV